MHNITVIIIVFKVDSTCLKFFFVLLSVHNNTIDIKIIAYFFILEDNVRSLALIFVSTKVLTVLL